MSEQLTEKHTKTAMSKGAQAAIIGAIIFVIIFVAMFWQILPRLVTEKNMNVETIAASPPNEEDGFIPATTEEETAQDNSRISELEEEIATLKETHQKKIAELKEQYTAENSENLNKAATAVSTMVVFSELKEAVKNGEPYWEELAQFKKLVGDKVQFAETIAMLEVNSKNGIVAPKQLKPRFSALIKDAVMNRNDGVFTRFMHQFIVIRKVGDITGNDDEAIMARAEVRLADDDISGTIKELEKLTPQAQEIFKSWVNDSEVWLESIEKIGALQLLLTQTESMSQI